MHRAFTLVEILVVIAIIGILAAILFPVFARARENARRALCQSNEKQIFLAHYLYKEDYDGIFPPAAYRNAQNQRVIWSDLFAPYAKSSAIFLCPSDANSTRLSYGLNPIAFADVENLPPQPGGIQLGALRFDQTSELIMLCETGTSDDFQTPVPDAWKVVPPSLPLTFAGDARPGIRHFGRANVLFLDGHIKSLALDAFCRGQSPPDRFFSP